jgi:hypothetical protein
LSVKYWVLSVKRCNVGGGGENQICSQSLKPRDVLTSKGPSAAMDQIHLEESEREREREESRFEA